MDLFDDLEDDLPVARPAATQQRFSCQSCGGSGLWQNGRVNQHGNNKCRPCGGRGFFVTAPADRLKAKQAAQTRKVNLAEASREANASTGIVSGLAGIAEWNSFAASLMAQHDAGKAWSENQIAAARRMLEKVEATRAAKAAEVAKRSVAVDLSRIEQMFETAQASGYKKPKYRTEAVSLSLAGAVSRNAGAIYVKDTETEEYLGKVIAGVFHPTRAAPSTVAEALARIAEDPKGEAVRYGQRTGRCCCCGRELTKHDSIDAGIGPICASKWGF